MIINNDAREIEKALELNHGTLKHAQNFVFYARKGEQTMEIHTKPVNEEQTKIEVLEVRGAII